MMMLTAYFLGLTDASNVNKNILLILNSINVSKRLIIVSESKKEFVNSVKMDMFILEINVLKKEIKIVNSFLKMVIVKNALSDTFLKKVNALL